MFLSSGFPLVFASSVAPGQRDMLLTTIWGLTIANGGEDEWSLLFRPDSNTTPQLLAGTIQKLARHLKSVKVNVAGAIYVASMVLPVDYEGLRKGKVQVVRPGENYALAYGTFPSVPAIQQVTV